MIDPGQLLFHVIAPVLKSLDHWSVKAERLILGTTCQESDCGRWLAQKGGGPALGIYQMEPATHDDLWTNFIVHRADLTKAVKRYMPLHWTDSELLVGNLYYATAMCRIKYLLAPGEIPDTLPGQAAYWKLHYNTPKGAGTEAQYIQSYNRIVGTSIPYV